MESRTVIYAALAFVFIVAGRPAAADKPNLLFIFADDIGYECLGSYGGLDFKAPHLDRMAREGIRFTRAHTSQVCTPSRVSLHTGMYVPRHDHVGVLPVHLGTKKKVDFESMRTFAQQLRKNGYATNVIGKWQLATLEAWPNHIKQAGFDSWCVWQIWRRPKEDASGIWLGKIITLRRSLPR
jgi:arylsulfatase A-like enzyme